MTPGLEQVLFWHWWILASLVLILELTHPVFLFLWVGISAASVGFLLLMVPGLAVPVQLAAFGILSLLALAIWRR